QLIHHHLVLLEAFWTAQTDCACHRVHFSDVAALAHCHAQIPSLPPCELVKTSMLADHFPIGPNDRSRSDAILRALLNKFVVTSRRNKAKLLAFAFVRSRQLQFNSLSPHLSFLHLSQRKQESSQNLIRQHV